MSRFLASVRSPAEAIVALAGGADIIDIKEPASGALGRVASATLAAILGAIGGRRPASATIGDVPLLAEPVLSAVVETAASGVAIVKIGFFAGDLATTLTALRPLTRDGTRLVAVLFADRAPDLANIVPACAEAGFLGVMLDTAQKGSGPLTRHLTLPALADFVSLTRRHGLISGLAGSLRLADIPALAPLGADYLGFRSALTVGARDDALDPAALRAVRDALTAHSNSSATEAAGARSLASAASSALAVGIAASKAI
jgi:uncharacterized protein (UPF0264 family)